MPLQYLKDDHNKTTAVVIPISDWERVTKIHQDIDSILRQREHTKADVKPSDYRGCISEATADKINLHIEQSRREWNNDI